MLRSIIHVINVTSTCADIKLHPQKYVVLLGVSCHGFHDLCQTKEHFCCQLYYPLHDLIYLASHHLSVYSASFMSSNVICTHLGVVELKSSNNTTIPIKITNISTIITLKKIIVTHRSPTTRQIHGMITTSFPNTFNLNLFIL